MKTKHAIIIWFVGVVILIIDFLFDIMHYPFAAQMAITAMFGLFLRITGFILFVYKFYKYPNRKEISVKSVIIIFIIGFMILLMGALWKIQHWTFAAEMITIGTIFKIIAVILLAYKLYKYPQIKEFLNS